MLGSKSYKPSKWQVVAAVDAAAAHGQVELVKALLARGARRMLREFDEEPNFQVRIYTVSVIVRSCSSVVTGRQLHCEDLAMLFQLARGLLTPISSISSVVRSLYVHVDHWA
jgi:hypothetical protein